MIFFRGKYRFGVKSGELGSYTWVGWTVWGGGEPVGEQARDNWTGNKHQRDCRVPGAKPVRL